MKELTFADIRAEYQGFVRRTLAQLGVASCEVDDVEQEVFRGIERGLPRFDPTLSTNPESALRGWIFAICERQAANHRRRRRRRKEVLSTNDEMDTSIGLEMSPEERLLAEERKACLYRALERMEPARRAVVVAYELWGVAMADVAIMLAIPVNTAWNRLRLARQDIRAAFRREDGEGGPLTAEAPPCP